MKDCILKYPVLIDKVLFSILLVSFFILMTASQSRGEDHALTVLYDNVLLITLDTTRPDHLGCYGYKRRTSPNIDELSREGVLFSNTYSSTSWTLPAHVSLMTSLNCAQHQVYYPFQRIAIQFSSKSLSN